MSTRSKIILFIALICLAAGGVTVLFHAITGPPPTAEEGITQALHDAQAAAQHRDLNGVMDLVSDDFRAGDWTKPRLRLYLSRELRDGRGSNYDVHVNAPRILPSPNGDPDEREVVTQASVFWADTGENIWGSNPVTLIMRQETERKWLFFTVPRWRALSIPEMNFPGAGILNGDG